MLDAKTRGTFPIVPTPFAADGKLLLSDIARLVDYYEACGVTGLTILGVFGEAFKLSTEEMAACIKEFTRCAAGRLPVIVGVTSVGLTRSVELGRLAMEAGASGAMLQPTVGLHQEDALVVFFERFVLQSSGGVPLCVMDDPQSSNVQISLAAWCRISQLPPVFMLKHEPLPGLPQLSQIMRAQAQGEARKVAVFSSSNAMYLPQELERGTNGTMVGVAYSDAIARICQLYWQGDVDGAADLHDAVSPIIRQEKQSQYGLAVRKEILRRRGALTSNSLRYPGVVLDTQDLADLDRLMMRLERRLAELSITLPLPVKGRNNVRTDL